MNTLEVHSTNPLRTHAGRPRGLGGAIRPMARAARQVAVVAGLFAMTMATAVASDSSPKTDREYLPSGFEYDAAIPTPESILGWPVGTWHARHDQIIAYFEAVAAASDRVELEDYGRSHEHRRLLVAKVASASRLPQLETIRRQHLAGAAGERDRSRDPVVIWMGYGVHGNESSASNASLLLLYFLAAAQGPRVDELLTNAVVIVDPCLNPDGLSRFAHWANSNRSKNLIADPHHREHHETWPGGRTNHYWFDLNRDWLLHTHPESRGRVELFQRWRPNLLTDYHEMGTDSTYFFQPGIPSRQNPRTPTRNLDLTRKVARFHADILDEKGQLYYTEESFDDFYYGKGSTYPDVHGAIGILFEQASSRGHLQESDHGPLDFPRTIENQFLTSLSSLEAGLSMRSELLDYQSTFYRQASGLAARDPVKGYVFTARRDPARERALLDILARHRIRVERLASSVTVDDREFAANQAYVVRCDQLQYRLIQSLFETRTEFEDNTFYDVSTWTFPLAFGLDCAALDSSTLESIELAELSRRAPPPVDLSTRPYAVAFEWHDYHAPRALERILSLGVRAYVATRPFTVETGGQRRDLDYGTIVIPCEDQRDDWEALRPALERIAREDAIEVLRIESGLTASGIDLGSPSLRVLTRPRPLLLVGDGVSAYEAGEVWHLLDQRYDVEVSMVELDRFGRIDLDRYTHVIAVQGGYGALDERARTRLSDWVREGGVFIATKGATEWAEEHLLNRKPKKEDPEEEAKAGGGAETRDHDLRVYADYESERAKKLVGGAIFEAHLDRTHPLGFGYTGDRIALFRNSTRVMPLDESPYANVAQYSRSPLLSGYASDDNVEKIAGTAAITAHRVGRGTVVRMVDNPNFRGFWYGTNKLFANALFFGGIIKSTGR